MREVYLITGGAGFIGSNFVRHVLATTAAEVVVVDKLTYAGSLESLKEELTNARVRFVKADIAEGSAMAELFDSARPTHVVNFAAETHVDRSIDGPGAFVRTNVQGTFELLEASRRMMPSLAADDQSGVDLGGLRIIKKYGSLGPTGLFTETTPYAPNSPYAATKAAADHLARAYFETYGLSVLVTNCSNNYGPYQHPEKLIPLMTLNALEGKPLPVYGDGKNIRDWLYVEDHCAGIARVLEGGRPGEKYNIGGGNERTNLEIVATLCAELEKRVPAATNEALRARGVATYNALVTHVADRPGHDRRYAIDASKLERELGWRARTAFAEGIGKTVDWYVQNRRWCEAIEAGKYGRERLGLKKEGT